MTFEQARTKRVTRIHLVSHDKPAGRPIRTFLLEEIASAILPEIREGDVLVRMEDPAEGLAREDDILLVRPFPAGEPPKVTEGMVVMRFYDDALWPEATAEGGRMLTTLEPELYGLRRSDKVYGYVIGLVRSLPGFPA